LQDLSIHQARFLGKNGDSRECRCNEDSSWDDQEEYSFKLLGKVEVVAAPLDTRPEGIVIEAPNSPHDGCGVS